MLVHDCAEVDDAVVVENLGKVSDLTDFVRAVAAWSQGWGVADREIPRYHNRHR